MTEGSARPERRPELVEGALEGRAARGRRASAGAGKEPGLLVTFEGGEGSGKSTQARFLRETLEKEGRSILLVREPGGTPLGEEVRRLLLHRETPLSPQAELLLFLAARAQLSDQVIRPALERGDIVISDRFSDSTLAYQGYGRRLNLEDVRKLDAAATGGLTPDLTILLDLPVEVGRQRTDVDEDVFQREDDAFHERVRDGYLALAKEQPQRWFVVDGNLPIEALREQIRERFAGLSSE